MRIRCYMISLLMGMIALCSCGKMNQPYLNSLITEDQTLVIGRDYEANQKPTEKDIYYQLTGCDISFSLEDYEFVNAEPNEDGLVYHVLAKSPEQPDFNVYQIGDYLGITSSRGFVEELIQEKEKEGDVYSIKNVCVGICDIGKTNIVETDAESISRVEEYIKTILPEISINDYSREVSYGDAGQTIFSYYEDDESKQIEVLRWISLYDDTEIWINICDRDQLDEFLGYS